MISLRTGPGPTPEHYHPTLFITTMPKRKRDGLAASNDSNLILQQKIFHGTKKLNHALKTAKGFERQKLAKRISKANSDHATAEGARLTEELSILKVEEAESRLESSDVLGRVWNCQKWLEHISTKL